MEALWESNRNYSGGICGPECREKCGGNHFLSRFCAIKTLVPQRNLAASLQRWSKDSSLSGAEPGRFSEVLCPGIS